MRERDYQGNLIKKLRDLFPGCVILKNDSAYIQGIPDLTILYRDRWAVLEVKASSNSPDQPNQQHYVRVLSDMSFAAVIFPENEESVLDELQRSFGFIRKSRVSKS